MTKKKKQESNILIATPNMGTLDVDYVSSLVATTSYLQSTGIRWATFLFDGAVTAEARNQSVDVVLNSEHKFTHLMFIDSDMTFPREGVTRLLNTGKPLIGGVYVKRVEPRELLVKADKLPPEGTVVSKVSGIGTGFMLIRKDVLEKVRAKYLCPFQYGEGQDGRLISEDYVFCERWREMGGEVWAKWDLSLGHVGKKTYR
jgi:hypothetical protein